MVIAVSIIAISKVNPADVIPETLQCVCGHLYKFLMDYIEPRKHTNSAPFIITKKLKLTSVNHDLTNFCNNQ